MQSPLSAKAALLLVLDYPAHGLELIRRVEERSGGAVSIRQGSVYPALRPLERERLVRSWKGRSAKGGGRPRTYYELTLAGVKAAAALKQVVGGFMKYVEASPPSAREAAQMRERLRRCAEVSAFCRELRRAGALAVAVHGYTRATDHVDILTQLDLRDVQKRLDALI